MKILISMLTVLFLASYAQATTVLYRISSGEVYGISTENDSYRYQLDDVHAVVQDPNFVDGTEWLDPNGNTRVLGYAKIKDGNDIRNATQQEIDGFATAVANDRTAIEVSRAIAYLNNHPQMKRILVALLQVLLDEQFNPTRAWLNDFKAEVAASTSLADFQSRVAALPSWNENVTMQNLKTAVENEIE